MRKADGGFVTQEAIPAPRRPFSAIDKSSTSLTKDTISFSPDPSGSLTTHYTLIEVTQRGPSPTTGRAFRYSKTFPDLPSSGGLSRVGALGHTPSEALQAPRTFSSCFSGQLVAPSPSGHSHSTISETSLDWEGSSSDAASLLNTTTTTATRETASDRFISRHAQHTESFQANQAQGQTCNLEGDEEQQPLLWLRTQPRFPGGRVVMTFLSWCLLTLATMSGLVLVIWLLSRRAG